MATKLNAVQLAYIQQEAQNAADVVMTSDLETLMVLFNEEVLRSGAAMTVMLAAEAMNWTAKHTAMAVAYAVMRQMRSVREASHLEEADAEVHESETKS